VSARCQRSVLATACFLVLAAALVREARAARCGDDIAGRRLACSCGDTVVSDTTLRSTDPIFGSRCPDDGLVIESDPYSDGLTLDLAGLAIVGSGVGTGISIEGGGSDGAVVTGGAARRGQVVGFGTGIRVRRARAVRRIERLDLIGNRHDGLALRTAGTMIIGVEANRNGGDGIRVSGRGGRLVDVRSSENGRAGVRAFTLGTVFDVEATRNGVNGVIASGFHNDLTAVVVTSNTGYGLLLGGTGHRIEGVTAEGNTAGDIARRTERPRAEHGDERGRGDSDERP